ncbi:polyhydroxyalkanoate synthesis regulator DNA-binding domain-containing protein [bacterium]|nr:polyhydroxyalkanoate synthesis regulator DNA-binding domain-containing protein [bacterium]
MMDDSNSGEGPGTATGGQARIIRRYQNRKLYDTEASKYVTLDDIAAMIKAGVDVKVQDNKSKKDLTAVTLTQIIFEEEKKDQSILPLSALKRIIQTGSESITEVTQKVVGPGIASIQAARQEVERTVERLVHRRSSEDGVLEPVVNTESKSGDGEELSKKIEENLSAFFERMKAASNLAARVEQLEGEVEELERLLERKRKRKPRAKKTTAETAAATTQEPATTVERPNGEPIDR